MNNTLTPYQKGDDSAFIDIYKNYYVPLTNYARMKVGDIHAAEDLVQELFAEVYLKRDITSTIEGYLFTALKRRILNYWRHQDVRLKYQLEKKQIPVEYSSLKVEIKDLMKDLYAHVSKLPPQCQRVFHLKKAEFTNKEIASELNISTKTVESHFTKALSYLRKNIEYPFLWFVYYSGINTMDFLEYLPAL